jgi:hypothetical protein
LGSVLALSPLQPSFCGWFNNTLVRGSDMTTDSNKLLERLRTYYGDDLACRMLLMDARHALEAMAGEVLAAEKRNLESSVNALGWMRLSDALKHIIWKHPDAAKEMMAADLPPLPAPEDAVKLTAERDRLKAALDEAVKWMDGCAVSGGYPTWHAKARKALGGDA